MAQSNIEQQKKVRASFVVEQLNDDYITVRNKIKNKEYEVEILVFSNSDIEEFKKIQEEIYSVKHSSRGSDLLRRLSDLLAELKEK